MCNKTQLTPILSLKSIRVFPPPLGKELPKRKGVGANVTLAFQKLGGGEIKEKKGGEITPQKFKGGDLKKEKKKRTG